MHNLDIRNGIGKTDTTVNHEPVTRYSKGFGKGERIIATVGTNCGTERGETTLVSFSTSSRNKVKVEVYPFRTIPGVAIEFHGEQQCEALIEALEYTARLLTTQLTANRQHTVVRKATAKSAMKRNGRTR